MLALLATRVLATPTRLARRLCAVPRHPPVHVTLEQPPVAPRHIAAPPSGTLLDAAHAAGLNLGDTCDATCTCTSCVVALSADVAARLPRPTPAEQALLDTLDAPPSARPGRTVTRLSCQVGLDALHGASATFPPAPATAPVRAGRAAAVEHLAFRPYSKSAIPALLAEHAPGNAALQAAAPELQLVANVLPFRTNNYVVSQLIDWAAAPDDPIFQLTFPQPGMLPETDALTRLRAALRDGTSRGGAVAQRAAADEVRRSMNPHPAKQAVMNVPFVAPGAPLPGVQHKYAQTVLFFPADAQYCHSYCTYCFRWAQFVGWEDAQFASHDLESVIAYLSRNEQVTDLLITGGDPMVLHPRRLAYYLDKLATDPRIPHVRNIRIGSKALAYWPYKFVTDPGSDDVMAALARVGEAGKHLSLMAHFTHPNELRTPVVREAVRRLRAIGVTIRCQAPLVRGINDDADTLAALWRHQVGLGMVPYYAFIERDTGPRDWFAVPLARALSVFQGATRRVSGLARTVRGPSMSCTPGKVCVTGVETVGGERVFVLRFLQARNPAWNERVFFARFDEQARWMDELRPAFGEERFFFEEELERMEAAALNGEQASGQSGAADGDACVSG